MPPPPGVTILQSSLGLDLKPLLALGGVGGLAAGFASQQILQNVVSGEGVAGSAMLRSLSASMPCSFPHRLCSSHPYPFVSPPGVNLLLSRPFIARSRWSSPVSARSSVLAPFYFVLPRCHTHTLTHPIPGVNLFLSRPFVVGEQVVLSGGGGARDVVGVVEAVEVLRTQLRTPEGVLVAVPNKVRFLYYSKSSRQCGWMR